MLWCGDEANLGAQWHQGGVDLCRWCADTSVVNFLVSGGLWWDKAIIRISLPFKLSYTTQTSTSHSDELECTSQRETSGARQKVPNLARPDPKG